MIPTRMPDLQDLTTLIISLLACRLQSSSSLSTATTITTTAAAVVVTTTLLLQHVNRDWTVLDTTGDCKVTITTAARAAAGKEQ